MVELMAAVGVMGIIAAVSLPMVGRTLGGMRLKGDAQGIMNSVALTKMRAASRFSRARLYVDLSTHTYVMQTLNKTTKAWEIEGGAVQLSYGVNFGLGGLGTPPPNTQVAIGQSSNCKDNNDPPNDIAGTACIVFNSRGIPVDSAGSPTGGNALYITDGTGVYATTVTATPLVRLWWSPVFNEAWVEQ
jgi:hypothetical protein